MRHSNLGILIILIAIVAFASGCSNAGNNNSANAQAINSSSKVEKVEVYHFHGTNQCSSCIAVGAYAEETVNTYFADELKSGKIVFGHINGELPENKALVTQYGATGSSLWIGVYNSNGFHAEQNTNVWYKISNKEDYMSYLKGILDKRLAGDMS